MELVFHYENIAKHNVSVDEVEEAFADPQSWSTKSHGGAYIHLGKTEQGRILESWIQKTNKQVGVHLPRNGCAGPSAKTIW
jgi:uncharacterized DUF497 family protein